MHILLHIRGLFQLLFRLDDQLMKPRTTVHPWRHTDAAAASAEAPVV